MVGGVCGTDVGTRVMEGGAGGTGVVRGNAGAIGGTLSMIDATVWSAGMVVGGKEGSTRVDVSRRRSSRRAGFPWAAMLSAARRRVDRAAALYWGREVAPLRQKESSAWAQNAEGWWWMAKSHAAKIGLSVSQVRSAPAPTRMALAPTVAGVGEKAMGSKVVRLWDDGRGKKAGRARR